MRCYVAPDNVPGAPWRLAGAQSRTAVCAQTSPLTILARLTRENKALSYAPTIPVMPIIKRPHSSHSPAGQDRDSYHRTQGRNAASRDAEAGGRSIGATDA